MLRFQRLRLLTVLLMWMSFVRGDRTKEEWTTAINSFLYNWSVAFSSGDTNRFTEFIVKDVHRMLPHEQETFSIDELQHLGPNKLHVQVYVKLDSILGFCETWALCAASWSFQTEDGSHGGMGQTLFEDINGELKITSVILNKVE